MKIAEVKGVYFEIPNNVWYSFFDSPYPAHKLGTAVDVYYYEKAFFPFEEGVVEEIKRVKTPQHVSSEFDYLIVVKVDEFCLKILHVKPTVRVGEKLGFGDEIGRLIVSGFFYPWSDKHAHFELRDCGDRYRARGGFFLKPLVLKLVPSTIGEAFEVVERKDFYCWLKPVNVGGKTLTPLVYQDIPVEGGLPHYGYGVIFGDLDKVEMFGKEIQLQEKNFDKVRFFDADFEVFANNQRVKGIGVYCNQGKVKLIGGEFKEGDVVKLRFS